MPAHSPRRLTLALAALGVAASLACSGLSREPGVCLPNQLDKQAWAYIEEKHLVEPGESVLAFYDATISLDGSEIAVLTDKRAVYHNDGRTTAIAWTDVTGIDRVDVPLGDAFRLTARNGQAMQIEIAAMNGGETWERIQAQAWQAAGGGRAAPSPAEPEAE